MHRMDVDGRVFVLSESLQMLCALQFERGRQKAIRSTGVTQYHDKLHWAGTKSTYFGCHKCKKAQTTWLCRITLFPVQAVARARNRQDHVSALSAAFAIIQGRFSARQARSGAKHTGKEGVGAHKVSGLVWPRPTGEGATEVGRPGRLRRTTTVQSN